MKSLTLLFRKENHMNILPWIHDLPSGVFTVQIAALVVK
jgi:hypothetical protein